MRMNLFGAWPFDYVFPGVERMQTISNNIVCPPAKSPLVFGIK